MKAVLSDRALIAVSGPEAQAFLQGLITNDIGKLAPDAPLYAALLTPQGKILFDFLIYERNGGILLDCAGETADAFQKRLSMYRLRAKVDIARQDALAVVASWNGTYKDGTLAYAEPGHPEFIQFKQVEAVVVTADRPS